MRSWSAIGLACLAAVGIGAATPNAQAEWAASERKALKDPTFCGRGTEFVVYTCKFGQERWSMCGANTAARPNIVVLRHIVGGRIVERIYSTDGPVEALKDLHNTQYTLSRAGTRYTVFMRDDSKGASSGLLIRAPGQPDRQMICRQNGDFQRYDPKGIPEIFSNELEKSHWERAGH